MKVSKFTLIELGVSLSLCGVILAVTPAVTELTADQKNQQISQTNLSKIGKSLTSYALEVTRGYFPCEVGKDKYGKLHKTSWVKAREDRNRSTYKTFQVIMDSEADITPAYENLISPIDPTLNEPSKRTNGAYEKLTRDNVGYHYVNGSISQRVIGTTGTVVRDLNEGFDNSKCGYVLYGSGSVVKVEKQGSQASDGINYRTNWYRNRDKVPNYKNFDNYTKRINTEKPDRVD